MSDISPFLIPRGFRFGATKAGLKASGRTDFALIVADAPASAAAVFQQPDNSDAQKWFIAVNVKMQNAAY